MTLHRLTALCFGLHCHYRKCPSVNQLLDYDEPIIIECLRGKLECDGEAHQEGADVDTPDCSSGPNAENSGGYDAAADAGEDDGTRLEKSAMLS